MKIALTVCHSLLKNGIYTSADGTNKGGVNEYLWCKKFVPILANLFKEQGHQADVIICPEKQFHKSSEEKNYKLNKINGKGYDLLIESHLNAYNGNAKGTETLYYSSNGKSLAQRVNDKLDDIFDDRGIKQRSDLYILRDTDCTAILNEYFFCDNKADYLKSDEIHEMELIAKKVVEGVLNKNILNAVDNNIYQIVTGGFGTKERADTFANQLRGLTGWYMEVKEVPGHLDDYRIETGGFTGIEKVEKKLNALIELTGWWATYQKI